MYIRASLAFCLGLWLATAVAFADTYYKYRDQRTGRDVFVNRLDQVPRRFRGSAKVVLQTDESATAAEEPPTEVIETPAQAARPIPRTTRPAAPADIDFRQAFSGQHPLRDGPEIIGNVLDAKFLAAGASPLTGAERQRLANLVVAVLIGAVVAGIAAFAAWLVIIIIAVRSGDPGWGVFMFIFWPLAYAYLFLHVGKGRALLKSLCAVGMLSPALVGLIGAWRFYAWFQAIAQVRGGHL